MSEINSPNRALVRATKTLGGISRAAGRLPVTRQAYQSWLEAGEVPILRALQLEKLTCGKASWQKLCPSAAEVLANTV